MTNPTGGADAPLGIDNTSKTEKSKGRRQQLRQRKTQRGGRQGLAQRALSFALAGLLALSPLTANAAAAEPTDGADAAPYEVVTVHELKLEDGAITLTATGYTQNGTSAEHSGAYLITGTSSTGGITITDGAPTVTLQDVTITGGTPIDIATGAALRLILSGNNTLTAGDEKAAIHVPGGAMLHISAAASGDCLDVKGGASTTDTTGAGAGIGGAAGEGAGTVIIQGGVITALGGKSLGGGAAGIGGGAGAAGQPGGNGAALTMEGGTLMTPTNPYPPHPPFGNHIGGGDGGKGDNGGSVAVTGGSIQAPYIRGGKGGDGVGQNGNGGNGGDGSDNGTNGNGGDATSVTITGGNVMPPFDGSSSSIGLGGTPIGDGGTAGTPVQLTNGSADVKLCVLSGLPANTAVSGLSLTPALTYTYGTKDMQADADGEVYLWLPDTQASAQVSLTAGGKTYTGTISGGAAAMTVYTPPVNPNPPSGGSGNSSDNSSTPPAGTTPDAPKTEGGSTTVTTEVKHDCSHAALWRSGEITL